MSYSPNMEKGRNDRTENGTDGIYSSNSNEVIHNTRTQDRIPNIKKPLKTWQKALIVICVLAIFAVIAVVVIKMINNNPPEEEQKTPPEQP